ncbi:MULTISPECIES: hypothetical protein [Pseudomonas syringae group]|uniref:Uncharacterized protein n=4 Tax=Pseudomonas syringae group TaxID=136849 RepID=A0A0P9MLZ0_PSESX|nr:MULTISPECIES: hypothetical protein [Pseudomonas syringae group]EGH12247.1 hypothetical protein PSYMP_20239 [Pseudomonas amygdali pv. morsprunorum str. M302280]KPW89642.1 Uncharacterized protein ALO79_04723 [Pseudomonas syringae pv. castaneae]POC92642.1 hypothetical protein BKM26_14450 [Pseudomonas avellanae]POD08165.1 hypothetical protein BKM20_14325 [Pseudomonas avellanae]POD13360.1 hypothetical protein BKM05_27295 [Pseudomonas avellanae]
MTTKADQWTQAFALLQRFERQIVMPNLFSWKYITDQCGISKATLWRNKQFEAEYQRIKAIVNSYTLGASDFNLEKSIFNAKDLEKDKQIEKLKAQVADLTQQLNRERERLIYASLIARRKNIDPGEFMDQVPVRRGAAKQAQVTPISTMARHPTGQKTEGKPSS